jgi:hypothetical protein
MLWKPTYETRVLTDVAFPRLVGLTLDSQDGAAPVEGAMLGAFGPFASAELGVWRRLLNEAFPERAVPTVLVRTAWSERERRTIATATAPKEKAWTLLANDPQNAWSQLVAPDRAERAFAAVVRGGVAKLLMVGLPTEEAWDQFLAELNK